MSSLYQIETELLEIFNTIEAQEGEITDEQYNQLVITEENFKEKLKSYHKAIQVFTGEMATCKEEEKRIALYRKVRENRINRLKQSVLDAVLMFGNNGKSGNKTIELDTFKAFTKSTQSVDVNEGRIYTLIYEFSKLVLSMLKEGAINLDIDLDIPGCVASINAQTKSVQGDQYQDFTPDDVYNTEVEVTVKCTLEELLTKFLKLYILLLKDFDENFEIQNCTPKEKWKCAIKDEQDITVATLNTNQTIQFK